MIFPAPVPSPVLSAQAVVALRQPWSVLKTLCERFEEHGAVAYGDRFAHLSLAFGTARIDADETTLTISAESTDETNFAYVKWSLAENLLGLAGDEAPVIRWSGHDGCGKPLPFFREMRVLSSHLVTPRMQRVVLAGTDLARFASGGGMHVRLLFPPQGREPQWPVMGSDGRPQWPDAANCPVARIYTIRHVDPVGGTVEIDMVLHEGSSPGADFARHAEPGTIVGMLGPSGEGAPEADWYLFAGDETALPAISRHLLALPAGATAVVRIEIEDEREQQELSSPARLDLQWIVRSQAAGSGRLVEAVRAVCWPEPETRLYVWAGCEYRSFKALRSYLRRERSLSREQHLVTAYWRRSPAERPAQRNDA